MITVMYDLVFGTVPGQEKHSEVPLVVHAQSMAISYRLLPYRDLVPMLPLVDALTQRQEMQVIVYGELYIHQYWRGGRAWLSLYLCQRRRARLFLVLRRVVGFM